MTAAALLGLAAAVLAVTRLRRRWLVATVSGASMEPTLRAGDRLLVHRRRPDAVRPGQIVVLAGPPAAGRPTWIVKRVRAVPGDPVPADLPRLAGTGGGGDGAVVPAGRLVLLGDNPARSADSRQHGYYRTSALAGTAVRQLRRYSPPHGRLHR